MQTVLEVENLCVEIDGARVVDEVSFALGQGKLHALVGESGSGKSMTAYALLRLLPPGARVVSGSARAGGVELFTLSDVAMAQERGRRIAMMLQEPLSALNPVTRVGAQISEALEVHQGLDRTAARARVIELLREVGIADPEKRADAFPHQLSGGMRQRVLLAAALACDPKVLIADEPTTALDATMRGVVLDLLRQAAARRQLAVLIITHDLGVVREVCDEVSVLYAGRIVERGAVGDVFARPQHPYTIGLLGSRPSEGHRGQPLAAMPGGVPQPGEVIPGCRFNPRCPRAQDRCRAERPPLGSSPHAAACFFPGVISTRRIGEPP